MHSLLQRVERKTTRRAARAQSTYQCDTEAKQLRQLVRRSGATLFFIIVSSALIGSGRNLLGMLLALNSLHRDEVFAAALTGSLAHDHHRSDSGSRGFLHRQSPSYRV
jgi:hypothetical protein